MSPRRKKEKPNGQHVLESASDAAGSLPAEESLPVEDPGLGLPVEHSAAHRRPRRSPPKFLSVPRPAGIKDFLELPEIIGLPDYDRYLLMLLWLLSRKGRVPNNPQWIAWRLSLGIDAETLAKELKKFLKAGLLVGIGSEEADPISRAPRARSRKPRALRTKILSPEAAASQVADIAPPDGGEPELSPAELLRRHRESWGQV